MAGDGSGSVSDPSLAIAIQRATRSAEVDAIAHLLDEAPQPGATRRFLADPGHHLLLAATVIDGADQPIGFATGVEMTHPDKGTEMFVYELGVDPPHRRRGVARALLEALTDLARERGCYGLWVLTEADNPAARATYQRLGAPDETTVLYSWPV